MRTSNRSGFPRCSRSVSATNRTAVYGPVCTVVWQGSAGDRRPYADQCRLFRPRNSRHTFATHLIESGTDLSTLQLLMGHQKLQDTTLYVHLSRRHLHAAVNPLERIHIPGLPPAPPDPAEAKRRDEATV